MDLELKPKTGEEGNKEKDELKKYDNNELFDMLVNDVNGWGLFQIRMGLLSLIVTTLTACNHHSPLYTSYKSRHMCVTTSSEDGSGGYVTNLFNVSELDASYDFDEIYQEKFACLVNSSDDLKSSCTGWIYDKSIFTDTIVTEWDLVCDRLVLLPTSASSYMAGVVIINTIGGILSDSIGRRKTILIFSVLHIFFSFLTSVSNSYYMFVSARFFVGGCIHTVWASMFVATIEIVCEPMRNTAGAIFNVGWNTGSLVMTSLAFWLRSWWKLQISFAVLSLPLLLFYFLVPESPRWLIGKGRAKEAKLSLLKIAEVNKIDIDETNFDKHFDELEHRILKETEEQNDQSIQKSVIDNFLNSIAGVFTNKEYLLRVVLMFPPWFAVGISAYGIHFSSKFVNFNIFGVAAIKEATAFVIILLIVPFFKMGKRVPSVLCVYWIAGILAVLFYVIPTDETVIQVVVFVLCQAFMLGLFYVIGTYTQDVFSTDIRATTFNVLEGISKIGTVFSPLIVDLVGEENNELPPVIFGVIVLFASLSLLFLPETKGMPLLQKHKDLNQHSCAKESLIGKLFSKFK